MLKHFTIDYRIVGSERVCVFHTYAANPEQAVQDLFDNVPDVLHGDIIHQLNAPAGVRRPDHEY
jgi:hypothetical protein